MKDFLIYCWDRQRPATIVLALNVLYLIVLLIMGSVLGMNHNAFDSPIITILNALFIGHMIGYAIYSVIR